MPVFNKVAKMAHNDTLRSTQKKKLLSVKLKEESSSDESESEKDPNNNNTEVRLENCIDELHDGETKEEEEETLFTLNPPNNSDIHKEPHKDNTNNNNNNNNNTPEAPEVHLNIKEPALWLDRMTITATRSLPADLNPNDDPKREEVFLQHAMLSVLRGITLLRKAGVPWIRPDNYYAEMYKSDDHMSKIRGSIMDSKLKIQDRAHRRAMKDQKKFGKEVQAEALRQKAKHKKELTDKLADWRRKRRSNEDPRSKLAEVLNDDGNGYSRGKGNNNRGGGGASKMKFTGGKKSLRPGGKAGRPGKNRRNRK